MSKVEHCMPSTTDDLLIRLGASPTDLKKLVELVLRRKCRAVGISGAAIGRWLRDDRESWMLVCDWLQARSIRIIVANAEQPTRYL
jgi:hypothetical protein